MRKLWYGERARITALEAEHVRATDRRCWLDRLAALAATYREERRAFLAAYPALADLVPSALPEGPVPAEAAIAAA